MVGSEWDEVLQELTKSVKKDFTNVSKNKLIFFCVTNNITRNSAENFLKNLKKNQSKNSVLALQKKEEGNILYKNKKYVHSVSLYTESIFLAKKNDECLPLAYSNRSLALQQLGHQLESIRDIDLALECGYPVQKRFLLVIRKAKCLVQLGNPAKARDILREILKEGGKDCDIIKKELEKLNNLKNKESCLYELPKPVGGENENFISASKFIDVFFDEVKGRHVKATADIEIGDVLFVEKPYAFVTFNKSCLNCCKLTKAPIPCWYCTDANYCSSSCRDHFWKTTHLFECGYADLFSSVGIAHLSLRIVLQSSKNVDELKSVVSSISEPQLKNGIVSYISKDYDAVYNLVHNFDKYNTSDLFQYAVTALLLALHLKNHTNYFSSDLEEENLTLLTSVLCRHIMQLICNGHAICDYMTKESQEELVLNKKEVRIGTAIYTSASMMNHSCEPSIINSFYNNYLIVRAAKPIKKGEEVFNCYGPHARRMNRFDRQEILSKQYFFECKCNSCLQKYDIQEIFTALKCAVCKGPLLETGKDSKFCLSCGKTCIISNEIIQECSHFYSLMKEGELLLNSNAPLALRKLLECWLLGRKNFYKYHKDLCLAANEVARCLINLNEYKRCICFLKCCIRSLEVRFGSFSVELADEMKNLGDIITSYLVGNFPTSADRNLVLEGVSFYERAQKIMTLLFGSQYKELQEIKTNIELLQSLLVTINKLSLSKK